MAIQNALVNTTGVDIFTCPGTAVTDEQEHAVTCIMFCNYSVDDEVITIHVIPSGGSVVDANKVIVDLSIPAGETFTFDTEKLVLATGDKVHAITTTADDRITSTVSSMRVS